jgi:hypothetical protein
MLIFIFIFCVRFCIILLCESHLAVFQAQSLEDANKLNCNEYDSDDGMPEMIPERCVLETKSWYFCRRTLKEGRSRPGKFPLVQSKGEDTEDDTEIDEPAGKKQRAQKKGKEGLSELGVHFIQNDSAPNDS